MGYLVGFEYTVLRAAQGLSKGFFLDTWTLDVGICSQKLLFLFNLCTRGVWIIFDQDRWIIKLNY